LAWHLPGVFVVFFLYFSREADMANGSAPFRRAALGLAVMCALASSAYAQLTPVRFRLDWVWQAPQSIWTLAHERGFFRDEGLDVVIDRGYGGPDTTGSVAAGAYDIGFTDINNAVDFNGRNPGHRLQCVLVVYDANLAAVITRKGNGITRPKDLEGRVIGAPLTTGGRTLFPAFARVNGIDASKITWETISIQLQDQQFAQGKFDAVASFATTSLLNLKLLGVDLNSLTVFRFFDYGLDLYGS
jgi:NitT/TauT family transport system substrate-binding protein